MGQLLHSLHQRQPLPAALAHYEGQAAIAELQRMQGRGLIPEPGCLIGRMPLGNASVLVEYEVTPGSYATFDEPAEQDQIVIHSVLINGQMVDADLFAPETLDGWIELIARNKEAA
jgi:hypothetical protein